MKRILAGMTSFLLLIMLVLSVQANSAQSAIVLDATSGRIIYEKNSNNRSLIASTTKIMTALVVCEQCNVLDRMQIPPQAVGIEGSSVYLRTGEVWTIQELLYAMMLHSGNDAAVALAIYCGGTVEGFAELMNDKARQLGLMNTHFVNPHGLDNPDHYSTASDLAVLAAYAMENPIFAQTVSTKTVNAGGRSLRNHNRLLWQLEGADGIKTGYTKAAGRILVSSASRQGRRLVAVTISDPNDWIDHKVFHEDGFARYTVQRILQKGDCLGQVDVVGGEQLKAMLFAGEDFSYSLAENENPKITLSPIEFIYAPVVEGDFAGYAYVCLGEKTIGKIPMFYGETVEQIPQSEKSIWQKMLKGFGR